MVMAYTGSWGPTTNWASGMTDVTFTPSVQIQSITTPIIGGNASPTGAAIPTGLGTVVVTGAPVIDPKHLGGYRVDGDKTLVNLVYCLLDTKLGGTFRLLWARANKQFIIRRQAPIRGIASPYRFYRGNQTKVDPLIKAFLPAEYRTAWPGFVYIVFENFDIAPYDNRVPEFDFQIGSDVTDQPVTEVESSLTQGAIASTFFNYPTAFDRNRGYHYQIYQDNGDDAVISIIDIATATEINRAAVTDGNSPKNFGFVDFAAGLDGSDYIVCTTYEPGTDYYQLSLVNAWTGEIVDILAPLLDSGTAFEPLVKATSAWSESAPQTYHVYCSIFNSIGSTGSGLAVAYVDVTAETMTWIIHPYTAPAIGTANTDVLSITIGPKSGTSRTVFWSEDTAGIPGYWVNKAVITTSSFTSARVYNETDVSNPIYGVAYDTTDNGLVILREDGSFKKITPGGSVVYETDPQAINNLSFNIGANCNEAVGFVYRAMPGFAYAIEGAELAAATGDIYEVDLSDGTLTQIIDFFSLSLSYGVFQYWDQYNAWMTGDSGSDDGIMNRVQLGDTTPNAVDLADIMLALTTFDGRHDSAETAFSNFPGAECYGVKYETDTSIQDALRALREPFDVSIVESDAKLKFRYPARDGSYALDATITAVDIVDKGQFTIEKVSQSEEEALIECEISFYDKNNYGERNTANFPRPTGAYDLTKSINKRSFNLPLYMTASRAKQQAALIVYRSVYALESYTFSIGPGLGYLEPGDIITFPFANDTTSFDIVAQIKDAQLNANYSQDISCYQYLQAHDATYTGAEIVIPPEAPYPSYITAVLLLEDGGELRLEGDMQIGVTDALLLEGII